MQSLFCDLCVDVLCVTFLVLRHVLQGWHIKAAEHPVTEKNRRYLSE